MRHKQPYLALRGVQAGLTLIEFMISIALGMIVVAALAMLIGNQSSARSEIDRAGRLIENGRYAITAIVEDAQMAGYWGEITAAPAVPASVPDPCSATLANIQAAMGLHVQGYDSSVFSTTTLTCTPNWKSGTDVFVVRRADPDSSDVLTGGATDLAKLTNGQMYLQTGLASATGTVFSSVVAAGASASNATTFTLVKKDGSIAAPRKLLVHIYYVATCDVCTGSSADTIPTLKRAELGAAGGATVMGTPVTIAEGVENLQFDYGLDSDGDGAPDGTDGSSATFSLTDWSNVMSARIYLLARSTETSQGFTDGKTYTMGSAGTISPSAGTTAYARHLFVQSVRLVNASLRRSS
jgi:type IV pilus assembly protein PilW